MSKKLQFRAFAQKVRASYRRVPSRHVQAAFVLVGGVAVLGMLAATANQDLPAHNPPEDTISYSTDSPDETKPDKNTYNWRGIATDPKYITLPSIAAEGFIQKVGVDQNRQIAVPNNVHMSGWFVDSVRPGEKGLSIIDGHAGGRTVPGIFNELAKLKVDDIVTIAFGDGSSKEFKVFELETVPEAEAASHLFNQNPRVTSQLNLITCAGQYDTAKRQYPDRVIVYASLLES